MSLQEIHAAIPHRAPFLLVDEIVSRDEKQIVCRKRFTGDEWFFAGHYPEQPIVPGVLLCEAALQTGAIFVAGIAKQTSPGVPVVTRINDVRFKQLVRPGDTVEITVQFRERLAEAYFFDAKIMLQDKLAARLEFACMIAAT
jgi:3-hydroxyacyl-[acyl-carrier-protein] dehydratase